MNIQHSPIAKKNLIPLLRYTVYNRFNDLLQTRLKKLSLNMTTLSHVLPTSYSFFLIFFIAMFTFVMEMGFAISNK